MTTTVTAKIQVRKGTAAQWTGANPILLAGELGYETDTGKVKIGDGTTAWAILDYSIDPTAVADHGALTGLADDDHAQYHTDARGDARYALTGHNHSGTYAPVGHNHSGTYVPVGADAADLGSGTATDNYVLTADGLGGAAWEAVSSGISDGATLSTGLTFPIAGLHILDTNGSHDLIVSPGSNLTADRTFTITTGDANRTLTLAADASISGTNTGDQDLSGYAPLAKGVTNGDSHDHSGGDGGQIAYSTLSGLPTLGTAAAQNTTAFEAAGSIATHTALTSSVHGISTFGATLVDDASATDALTTLGILQDIMVFQYLQYGCM